MPDKAGASFEDALPYEPGPLVCGLGVEVNVDYVAVVGLTAHGQVAIDRRVPLDVPVLAPKVVLDRVADIAQAALDEARQAGAGVSGLTLAVPGLVDVERGTIVIAPNIGWRDLPAVHVLQKHLGLAVHVENDANLSALAEHAFGVAAGVDDLAYLTGETGIGAGIISAGQLLRGATGMAGEIGHLPLDPAGHPCGCGRFGCWETGAGLATLLRAAADPDDMVRDPSLDVSGRIAEIARRAALGDRRTRVALEGIGTSLGLGASVLVNLLNPSVLVLGGYFADLGPWLIDRVRAELAARVVAPTAGRLKVELSTLGFTAAARGGALLALGSERRDRLAGRSHAYAVAPGTSQLAGAAGVAAVDAEVGR